MMADKNVGQYRTVCRTADPQSYRRTVPPYRARTDAVRKIATPHYSTQKIVPQPYRMPVRAHIVPPPQSLDWGGPVRRYGEEAK